MRFDAPIPGQSLTHEPGSVPWENPPLYETQEDALAFYMEKLEDEESLEDLLFVLEMGMPVEIMVDGMTSMGVMEGYHTFDVKMLVSPIIHEHIVSLAEAAGIKYKEEAGPSKEERMKERDQKRAKAIIEKAIFEDEGEEGPDMEAMEEQVEEPEEMEEEEVEKPTPSPMGSGFIQRR